MTFLYEVFMLIHFMAWTNIGNFHMVNYEISHFKMRPSKEWRLSVRNTAPTDKHELYYGKVGIAILP